MSYSTIVPAIAAALLLTAAGDSVHAQEIAPHVARYRMDVEEIRMPGIVGSSGGDLVLRMERRCKDWALFSRMEFTLHGEGNAALSMESLSGLEESLKGDHMRFRTEQRINGQTIDVLTGVVEGKKVTFSQPEDIEPKTLPGGVQFPVQSMQATLRQIQDGDKIRTYQLFAGDDKEAVRVSDLTLGEAAPLTEKPEGDQDLLQGRHLRMVSSFFPLSSADSEPIFVSTYDLLANGVTTRLTVDAGAIVAKGTLTHLEKLAPPDCSNGT